MGLRVLGIGSAWVASVSVVAGVGLVGVTVAAKPAAAPAGSCA
jgi:hypothetical protein